MRCIIITPGPGYRLSGQGNGSSILPVQRNERGFTENAPPGFTNAAEVLPEDLLFDLETDVGETRNLASEHPEVVQRLTELANRAREEYRGLWTKRKK